uniref:Uncharacterized protein n=1 Tax=Pyxicephalus adspersus TaxID=30357 RepID=A0AAV3AIG2_PYXAD|nr:TPA: hypothetical protein GDO54_010639 [Pyxicephalus adspersus]
MIANWFGDLVWVFPPKTYIHIKMFFFRLYVGNLCFSNQNTVVSGSEDLVGKKDLSSCIILIILHHNLKSLALVSKKKRDLNCCIKMCF